MLARSASRQRIHDALRSNVGAHPTYVSSSKNGPGSSARRTSHYPPTLASMGPTRICVGADLELCFFPAGSSSYHEQGLFSSISGIRLWGPHSALFAPGSLSTARKRWTTYSICTLKSEFIISPLLEVFLRNMKFLEVIFLNDILDF